MKKLVKHIFTLEENPNWIPYVTSYYKKYWGFCMKESDKRKMKRENIKFILIQV